MIRLAIVSLVLFVEPLNARPQNTPHRLSKEDVVKLLSGQVAPHRVAQRAHEQGIDFELTTEVEKELRQLGATDELITMLRQLATMTKPVQTPAGTLRENLKDGLKYVWIPPGTFTMGCSQGDNECFDNEKPAHRVTFIRGFWMGQTPVTVGAYKRFAGTTGKQLAPPSKLNQGWTNDEMPMVEVFWHDAKVYCEWVGGRLPTEAEWEYAARGGSTEARYGNIDGVAWYRENSGSRPHEVAQKRANGFGLFDMLGNVREWVSDWYDEHYYQNSPSQSPPGSRNGEFRVLRGGSWYDEPTFVRVSNRVGYNPATGYGYIGFRCAGD